MRPHRRVYRHARRSTTDVAIVYAANLVDASPLVALYQATRGPQVEIVASHPGATWILAAVTMVRCLRMLVVGGCVGCISA